MTPMRVPKMLPLPPINEAPPMAAAAIASSSQRLPMVGSAAPRRPIRIRDASEASTPEIT
ncbi:hypothetical protein COLO4_02396 [Corchorus olitorius]|uniref:Uncharacterized protein n=1 Tax=Corchorus olitorius TaxID=93759 RepID=A0A1R3L104_9ROSI|nr:hypothetical protein COLO4_02396 [Corchorus olitorius]